mmetsp:Transcript_31648/g.73887  ORF Transcript_31648/g.73887 Transcript_31648/m.73887 type:complete len:144 (-) Transcript_31648:42-473(-)
MFAFSLPSLSSQYAVEQAVATEQNKLVCLRIGHQFDPACVSLDEVLRSAVPSVEAMCSLYTIDSREVPECVQAFQVQSSSALVFFFRGRLLQFDLGQGPCSRIECAMSSRQEFTDLVEAAQRGVQLGRDLIIAPRDYSLQMRY